MSTNRLQNQPVRVQSGQPGGSSSVDQNELNNIIDTLLEVRHNIKADSPDFGIKPVNLTEKQIEMLIEKS
jgi:hypothetical protein